MSRRKSTALKVPKQIVELQYAYLPWIECDHRIIVEFPSKGDVQAALILTKGSGAPARKTLGAAVIIPQDAPHTLVSDPAWATAVGLVYADLGRTIRRLSVEPFAEEMRQNSWQESPFSWDGFDRMKMGIEAFIAARCTTPAFLPGFIRETARAIEDFQKPKPNAFLWSPVTIMRGRPSRQHADNWRVVEEWHGWNHRKLFLQDRAKEFFGKEPSKAQMKAFRERLRYLHLRAEWQKSHTRGGRKMKRAGTS